MNNDKQPFCMSIGAEATVLGYPASLTAGYQHDVFCFQGNVSVCNGSITDFAALVDSSLAKEIEAYLPEALNNISANIYISHLYNHDIISIDTDGFYLAAISSEGKTGFILSLLSNDMGGYLGDIFSKAVNQLNIQKVYFYYSAKKMSVSKLLKPFETDTNEFKPPAILDSYSAFLFARWKPAQGSLLFAAFQDLFDISELDFYAGLDATAKKYIFILDIPKISNNLLTVEELYMSVNSTPQGLSFSLHGKIEFGFTGDVKFTVNSIVSMSSFVLSAQAVCEKPIRLFGSFSLRSCTLSIGYDNGLLFGLIGEICIRKMYVFAAISFKQQVVLKPSLLCFSVSRLSLPVLIENLVGVSIPDEFDFISVNELPFACTGKFNISWFKSKDYLAIASHFNSNVKDSKLYLSAEQLQTGEIDGGYTLIDKKRMRHYFVNSFGNISLRPQLYYSDCAESFRLGDYEISGGIFLCGVIEIFKLSIRVLFSFRKDEGVIAFAFIQSLDLGFLKITQSDKGAAVPIPLPQNSIVYQFIDKSTKGLLFYLNASKTESSFYLDGKISILGLFSIDALIYYQKGIISINIETCLFGMTAILSLNVNYTSFQNAAFSFYFEINTYKLEEKLNSVRRRIESAIIKCRQRINNATRSLRDAQAKVDRLYGEIRYLDNKIENCRRNIRNARWWQKAFVAIAMGVEIAALGVAKAAIWTAINIAKAALEVAIAIVNFAGQLSESVLKLVNGVITAATSLFFLRKIAFSVSADASQQAIFTEIAFVALGKEYHFKDSITKSILKTGGTAVISDKMNQKMDKDLKDIENGTVSNYTSISHTNNKYASLAQLQARSFFDKEPDISDAKDELDRSMGLLRDMEHIYIDSFESTLPEFEEFNHGFMEKLSTIQANLDISKRSTELGELKEAVSSLEKIVNNQDCMTTGELQNSSQAREAIRLYHEAEEESKEVDTLLSFLDTSIVAMQQHNVSLPQRAALLRRQRYERYAMNEPAKADMKEVIIQCRNSLYHYFPKDYESSFINLSQDQTIINSIDEAEEYFNN